MSLTTGLPKDPLSPLPSGVYMHTVLEIRAGHWPFFNIWPNKIHFGQPNLLYIFNGIAINNLQNVPSSKKLVNQFLTLMHNTHAILFMAQNVDRFLNDICENKMVNFPQCQRLVGTSRSNLVTTS